MNIFFPLSVCLDSCFFCSCHFPWLWRHFMHSYKMNLNTSKLLSLNWMSCKNAGRLANYLEVIGIWRTMVSIHLIIFFHFKREGLPSLSQYLTMRWLLHRIVWEGFYIMLYAQLICHLVFSASHWMIVPLVWSKIDVIFLFVPSI